MAKDKKAIYAPGELARVRKNLGAVDHNEAKRMSERLGGEIGYERAEEPEQSNSGKSRRIESKSGSKGTPRKRLELASDVSIEDDFVSAQDRANLDPSDDPSVPLKYSFIERVRMDRYAAQSEFEIKSSSQVLYAMFSFMGEPPDLVNPYFITRRMTEYYAKIESMTLAVRSLLPRNNARRSERMKKNAPMAFAILDVIRYWDIEKISAELTKHQSHPRNVKVHDFSDILRAVYRPLFILENLDMEAHIRAAFKIMYKALYMENPMEAQNKYQSVIRTALSSFAEVRKDIKFLLYPLLMKIVSSTWLPYSGFFMARKHRLMSFLNLTERDKLIPSQIIELPDQMNDSAETSESSDSDASVEETPKTKEEEKQSKEENAGRAAENPERKAMDWGKQALELLFPKAGWDKLSGYPDLYPYFHNVLDLKRGIVNISPKDPLQQVFILMRIVEELFFGLRYVSFGTITNSDGGSEHIEESMVKIINTWHHYIQATFEKDYLPNLTEYVRIMEGSPEEKHSTYAKKILSSLHWIKRLCFLPYYKKFDSFAQSSFQKNEATPVYAEVKKIRKYLTAVAAGIDQGKRAGGMSQNARCDGIENPWDPYNFEVPNAISKRLNALMAGKNRNNAALIYFTLAAIVVLDNLVNNENSWAYTAGGGPLFRSENNEGIRPITGVDTRVDADKLFRDALEQRKK
ncbi:MAG: hypothetical protein LBH43_07460 [Treponema sp.]|jgi:hypothetical protein|nr:hypothetical protein [Treponema sp.]